MTDWTDGDYCDGPMLVAWIERNGITCHPDRPESGTWNRALHRWRHGGRAGVESVDLQLTRVGHHLSEVPDECWHKGPLNVSRAPQRERALSLLAAGKPLKPLARELGIAPSTLRGWNEATR